MARVHLIAIGGTGMAPLACLLKELGHEVRGSDGPLYPPMSTLLEDNAIEVLEGFTPDHLDPSPDLVIVGNAVPRSNPEAVAMEERGLRRLSMPEALAELLLSDRRPLVIAGSHGKTTTTSLASWVYHSAGRAPGFLIGGIPVNLNRSFQLGSGPRFIIEGDEYNAAYFDREAKFLHYLAETVILTSVEYDHADLYPDEEALRHAFRKLLDGLPESGRAILCADSEGVEGVASSTRASVIRYGTHSSADVGLEGGITATSSGIEFVVRDGSGSHEVELPMWGEHNVLNALGVWTAARGDGLTPEQVREGLASFRGVKRRLEEIGTSGGVAFVDDFAHHPTEVEKTLQAVRDRYPGRRIVCLFEPRSLSAGRSLFFNAYERAFRHADVALFAPIFHASRLTAEERLDFPALARRLPQETTAVVCDSLDAVYSEALARMRPDDVVITMSSGSFEGMARRLFEARASQN